MPDENEDHPPEDIEEDDAVDATPMTTDDDRRSIAGLSERIVQRVLNRQDKWEN